VGEKEMSIPLHSRLIANVNELRLLVAEYHLLDEVAQKNIRHQIYVHTGGFGKAVVPLFGGFKMIEEKLINEGKQ
jgi:hypothetical protein